MDFLLKMPLKTFQITIHIHRSFTEQFKLQNLNSKYYNIYGLTFMRNG